MAADQEPTDQKDHDDQEHRPQPTRAAANRGARPLGGRGNFQRLGSARPLVPQTDHAHTHGRGNSEYRGSRGSSTFGRGGAPRPSPSADDMDFEPDINPSTNYQTSRERLTCNGQDDFHERYAERVQRSDNENIQRNYADQFKSERVESSESARDCDCEHCVAYERFLQILERHVPHHEERQARIQRLFKMAESGRVSKLSDGLRSMTLRHGVQAQTDVAKNVMALKTLIAGVAACRREKQAKKAPEEKDVVMMEED